MAVHETTHADTGTRGNSVPEHHPTTDADVERPTVGPEQTEWFYERDGHQVGPFSEPELSRLAEAGMISAGTVLLDGTGRRMRAAAVILQGASPAAPATMPVQATGGSNSDNVSGLGPAGSADAAEAEVAAAVCSEPRFDEAPPPSPPLHPPPPPPQCVVSPDSRPSPIQRRWNRLREIAYWQRMLNMTVLLSILLGVFLACAMSLGVPPEVVDGLVSLLAVMALPLWIWFIARLAKALWRSPWWYGFLGLIPGANAFVLLHLNGIATSELIRAGIRVGFLGTSLPEQPPSDFATVPGKGRTGTPK